MEFCRFLALCCLLVSAHGRIMESSAMLRLNVNERCKQNSLTPVSCADAITSDSLLPHPDDCQLFYYCLQPYLSPVCTQCPSGLYFNPIRHVCDWPSQAGCHLATTTTNKPIVDYSTTQDYTTTGRPTTAYPTTEEYTTTAPTTTTTEEHTTTAPTTTTTEEHTTTAPTTTTTEEYTTTAPTTTTTEEHTTTAPTTTTTEEHTTTAPTTTTTEEHTTTTPTTTKPPTTAEPTTELRTTTTTTTTTTAKAESCTRKWYFLWLSC